MVEQQMSIDDVIEDKGYEWYRTEDVSEVAIRLRQYGISQTWPYLLGMVAWTLFSVYGLGGPTESLRFIKSLRWWMQAPLWLNYVACATIVPTLILRSILTKRLRFTQRDAVMNHRLFGIATNTSTFTIGKTAVYHVVDFLAQRDDSKRETYICLVDLSKPASRGIAINLGSCEEKAQSFQTVLSSVLERRIALRRSALSDLPSVRS